MTNCLYGFAKLLLSCSSSVTKVHGSESKIALTVDPANSHRFDTDLAGSTIPETHYPCVP
jgi:hypothetical protein